MSKTRGFNAFPLWLNDWRGSTARAELSLAGRAAYLELLTWQFTYGSKSASKPGSETGSKRRSKTEAGLPQNDRELARLVGVTVEEWLEVKAEVLRFFDVNAAGRLENSKVSEEIAYTLKKVLSGRKGGSKRGSKP